MQSLSYSKLDPRALAPTRKHSIDAGLDLYALDDASIQPLHVGVVRTGLAFQIPEGYVLQVWPKGRSNYLIGAGIIDPGYAGEILVKVFNSSGSSWLEIASGTPVAQIVIVPLVTPKPVEVETIQPFSERGATGGIHG